MTPPFKQTTNFDVPAKRRQISLFGAAPDTGNLGVLALCYSTVINLIHREPGLGVTVFDHGRGERQASIALPEGEIKYKLSGAVNSRRFYRSENLWLMRLAGRFGGCGNQGIATISHSDAVMDISGGDSFTDLYGLRRFKAIVLPKVITLQQNRPLILLPQTYGPFKSKKCKKIASEIVRKANAAWARDERSYDVLKELLGGDFDSEKHRCGVDVAFGLPAVRPSKLSEELAGCLLERTRETIGINISGLIYNNPQNAYGQFGFKANYNKVVENLLRLFLDKTDCNILLVPHVVTPRGHFESDIMASEAVLEKLGYRNAERVSVVPAYNNPCEIKWVISKLDWFCGTRMHATIAALSSGVPVSAISYSPKTLGVFETCGQGEHVADPLVLGEDEVVEKIWESWISRKAADRTYTTYLPKVLAQSETQMKSILDVI